MKIPTWNFLRKRPNVTQDANRSHIQQVLFICHGDDEAGLGILDNLCVALEFGKIKFMTFDTARPIPLPQLDQFDTIILATELIWQWGEGKIARLEEYVRAGGGLLVAYRCWCEGLADVFAMPVDGAQLRMHSTKGLHFRQDMLPGAAGLRLGPEDWDFDHNRYDVDASDLSPGCTVLATDLEGRPVAWRHRFGEGRVFFWNTRLLAARAFRGFALQSLLDTMSAGVSAIAGFAMFHVDDFPPSLSQERKEPVVSEHPGLDWDAFFFDVWHRDMMALRAKYGLKYTWYVVMNYFDVENGPDGDPAAPAIGIGADVLARRFAAVADLAGDDEYGFHGYNHEPLTLEAWPDLPTLEAKLQLARALWQDAVPAPLPTSWVPANNWYHSQHLRTLKRVFPEVTNVCGLYTCGDFERGEFREFGPEPWEPSLTCLPRETYGYILTPGLRMMMLSQIASMGMWTHFIHPDDIYDIPADGSRDDESRYHRNGDRLYWNIENPAGKAGLYHHLEKWVSGVRTLFPWLEFVTTSDAAACVHRHRISRTDVFVAADLVEIHGASDGLYYLRTDRGVVLEPVGGAAVLDTRTTASGLLHVVKCPAGVAVFRLTPTRAPP